MSLIVSIGEVLWDVFPEQKRVGGASANFLWHCSQLGAEVELISAVGNDTDGREILDILSCHGIVSCLSKVNYPTGIVNVLLDEEGKPVYEITEGSAWDNIPVTSQNRDVVSKADVIHFGTLSQRNDVTAKTVKELLELTSNKCIKIFDINIRQSYYNKDIITTSLEYATVLKLSNEELPIVCEYYGLSGDIIEQLKSLKSLFSLDLIAYTRGPDGSILVSDREVDEHLGCPGKAVNSVGAGDSFLASLVSGVIKGRSLKHINDFANRVGTFVCSQDGATPILPKELVSNL